MEQRAIEAVTVLLNSYRLPSDTDKDMLLRTYLMAVDELPDEAIVKAAMRFIRGDVEHQDKRFAPSTAEFASEARSIKAQLEWDAKPKLPEPEEEVVHHIGIPPSWMQAYRDWWRGAISGAEFYRITGKKIGELRR